VIDNQFAYMTFKEFCDLSLEALKEQGVKVDELWHPEDIEVTLTTFMRPFASGMGEAMRRRWKDKA
jgi:hypothetical protein